MNQIAPRPSDAEKLSDERTCSRLDDAAETGAFTLLVSIDDSVSTVALPASGTLAIGRAETCEVRIRDDSVSRCHARVRAGDTLMIEDCGSTNGTRLAGAKLVPGEPTPLEVGSVVEIGKALVIVQRAGAGGTAVVAPPPPSSAAPNGLILEDPTMKQLYRLIDVVAPTTINVLILGETGVGKEVFAETIHKRSARAHKPFLRLNCAALPESILESELFGHERGSFTGALQTKIGLFESADGGTVFLDELGELPLATQAKLLRVLESGEVTRVGSVKTKKIDFRLISATNRDLQARIDQGLFRADLFFRINGFATTIPPLRDRKEDITAFARHFLDAARRRFGATPATLSPAALRVLQTYPWPGNVRELRNCVDRAALLCKERVVQPGDLGIDTGGAATPPSWLAPVPTVATPIPMPMPALTAIEGGARDDREAASDRIPASRGLRAEIDALERERILATLEECGGNQSRTARTLGMARRTLLVRLDEYGVTRPRKVSGS